MSLKKGNPEFEATYFGIEAYLGATKHGGSLASTRELIELCHIDRNSFVLDIGCGVGATACYLAKAIGCSVIGVDIRGDMIARSQERVRREKLVDQVSFQQGDAQQLPFKDGSFDAVISESVTLFVDDREMAVKEYVRVTKLGGYVGLNEEVWVRSPVPQKVIDYMKHGVEVSGEIPQPNYWATLMEGAGLHEVTFRTYKQVGLREISRLRRYSPADLARGTFRLFSLLLKPEARSWIKTRMHAPLNLTKYLGYGVYVGRK